MINDRSAAETLMLAIGLTVVIIAGAVIAFKLVQLVVNRLSRKEEEA
ncbi:MAG: hypothetical protein O9340_02820 [Cyclobacteriaceae bacterium]|jgi:hypothetical protein|nr:hypothetical protein [Cyclobacteriaceae bacterium]